MNSPSFSTNSPIAATDLIKALRDQAAQPNDTFELSAATIEGDVDLSSLSFQAKLVFHQCTFRGKFDASEAQFAKSLTLSGCRFERSLRMFGARIGGQLLLEDATIRDVPSDGASLEQLQVAGNLSAGGLDADGRLNFRGARIDGQLDLSGVRMSGELSLQNAQVAGSLFCRPRRGKRSAINGNVWLYGIQVGDLVEMSGAQIGGDLLLEDAVMKSGLFCKPQSGDRTEIKGQVLLTGAKSSGAIDLGGANIGGDVLAESAMIDGGFFCRPEEGSRTDIGGRLWLSAIHIASQLSIAGAKIGGNVVAQHAQIDGGVVASPLDGYRTEIEGQLWMVGAKIDGGVDLTGSRIAGDAYLQKARFDDLVLRYDGERELSIQGVLDLEAATVSRLELDGRATGEHAVHLTLASITHLHVLESLPNRTELEGFQFQQLTLPGNNYLGWLSASVTFQSSTYVFMENWLRNHGDHATGNRVYLAMRRRDRRQGTKNILQRISDWFLDLTVGYGIHFYRPLIFYFVPVLILSVVLFSNPRSVEMSEHYQSLLAVAETSDDGPSEWGATDAWVVAVRTNLPMINLMVDDDWQPSSRDIECWGESIPFTYAAYALIASLLSWIAVPLFVVGMSGVLKKEA